MNSSSLTTPDGGSLVITNMTVEEEVEEATLEQCALFACSRPSTSVETSFGIGPRQVTALYRTASFAMLEEQPPG